jgi:hypothetical protein
MTKLWLTYAWKDNEDEQVDFVAQELRTAGLDVSVDRVALVAGRRLWPEIREHIEKPENSDAWALYVTENSLRSETCQDELAIALDRALRSREDAYPLIGIFPGPIDRKLVPPAIRIRLYVNLTDKDWIERVRSGAAGVAPSIKTVPISPFVLNTGKFNDEWYVEIRPRAGRWLPTYVVVAPEDIANFTSHVVGPADNVTDTGTVFSSRLHIKGRHCGWRIDSALTPQDSLYQFWRKLPSEVNFGPDLKALFSMSPSEN